MAETNAPVELKIAYIGGGSRGWAQKLMGDLAVCPDLTGEVVLYDSSLKAAQRNAVFGTWLQQQSGVCAQWQYRAVELIDEALVGADFVFISIQPGTLEMMGHEIAVAEKYGLYFPVGDTTGAPGLMRGIRSAQIYEGFAEAIAEHCPDAWVINYTNPMTICTRTLTEVAPDLKVIGSCHEVFGTQHILAELAQQYLHLDRTPSRDQIEVNVLGINHFTWIDRATYQGHDLLAIVREHMQAPGVIREHTREEIEAKDDWFVDSLQVKLELFRRFGILAAAGDRHLCEFVPGFIRSPAELFRWGLIRTPISYRLARWSEASGRMDDLLAGRTTFALGSSGEEAVRQVRALLGLGDFVTNVNVANRGQIANLPLDAVVETNAYFGRDRVQPLVAGPLPGGVHALVARHVANQEQIIEAALTRDRDLAFQAIFNDPTTSLSLDRAWAMFEELETPHLWDRV